MKKLCLFIFALSFGVLADDNRVIVSSGQQDILSMTELDPHERTSEYLEDITRQIYDTLYTIDKNGNIQESLATSCVVKSFSEDVGANAQMDVVCKIRENIYFHDGLKLTPKDVVFSVSRLKNSSTLSSYLSMIKEVSLFEDGVKFILKYNVAGIDDPKKWLFERFKRVVARYPYIVRADYFTGGAGWALEYPVGTGPFYFKDWKLWEPKESRSQIILEKNKSYWKNEPPKVDEVLFRFLPSFMWQPNFSNGTVSLLFRIPYEDYKLLNKASNKNKDGFRTLKKRAYSYQYLVFNPRSEILKPSSSLRKAFVAAVNREKIARMVFGKDVVINSGAALNSSVSFPDKFITQSYNPVMSKKAVRSYMRSKKISGDRLAVSILIPDTYESNLVADELIKELYLAGFLANVKKLSYAAYSSNINKGSFGNFDVMMYSVNENPNVCTLRVGSILKNGGIQLYQRYLFYALLRSERGQYAKTLTTFIPPVEGPLVLGNIE